MATAGPLNIAMLSVHSSPIGPLGTRDTGGMSVYVRELARELGGRGHRVDIYTRRQDPSCDRVLPLYRNVRLIALSAGIGGRMDTSELYPHLGTFFRNLEAFRSRERLGYDLIHSHYWLSAHVGHWAQAGWDLPHLVMFHTLGILKNITSNGIKEPAFRIAAERQSSRTCDRILAVTEDERRQLTELYGAPGGRIAVVPCGVDMDLFRPLDRRAARQHLRLPVDAPVLLYVGRFDPLKGIDRLLEAAANVKQDRPCLRLLVVGGDGHGTNEAVELQRLSRTLDLQTTVTFVGPVEQDELPTYYSAADLLVVPSLYESFGLVALESLASGTPVVATRVGAMETLLHRGVSGQLVTDGSPAQLARGIQTALGAQTPATPETIRASVSRFSWPHIASAVLDVYRSVLAPHAFVSDAARGCSNA